MIDQLTVRPPETFDEAVRLREELTMIFRDALLEESPVRIAFLVEQLKQRLDMLEFIRAHFKAELKRLECDQSVFELSAADVIANGWRVR